MPGNSIADVLGGSASWALVAGDARAELGALPAESVDCCVTSPPYFGLRNYGESGQLGLEASPEEYVSALVEVLDMVRRALKREGTLWLNLGDCYASQAGGGQGKNGRLADRAASVSGVRRVASKGGRGLRRKDLIGIPWLVAFALRDAGWRLRSSIVWSKPNPMPESVRDRPTRAHELVFMLSRSARYYFDDAALSEPCQSVKPAGNRVRRLAGADRAPRGSGADRGVSFPWQPTETRRGRDVWTIATQPYKAGAHFATMPVALAERCVLAGCPRDGVVLDPFAGVATTGLAAIAHGRRFLGIEIAPRFVDLGAERLGRGPRHVRRRGDAAALQRSLSFASGDRDA